MKFNWGYKIAAFYLVFVAGILYLVVQSSRQQMDLVTPDYYAQEIKYQEKIDQSKRAAALSEPIRYQVISDGIQISFPQEFQGKSITGDALLYYPADEKKDIAVTIQTNQNQMIIPIPDKRSGMHILKVNWEVDGVSYYFEEPVFMP
jgi:nitrogen fixation protein FixH